MTLLTQSITVNTVVFLAIVQSESSTNVIAPLNSVSFPGDEFVERPAYFLVYCNVGVRIPVLKHPPYGEFYLLEEVF